MIQASSGYDGVFTVDVEDYFHVSAFASQIRTDDWHNFECRVEHSTRQLLRLADDTHTQGTFFVLGWVADRLPGLIREIHAAGHEIGCHSYWHQLVYRQSPGQFREDLIRSRDAIQQVSGHLVTMYRAPSFSITADSLWALRILAEEGFEIDSSIYPIHHDRYGLPASPLTPYRVTTDSGSIVEFPGMVCEVGCLRIPVGGGGYLRLMPWRVTRHLLHAIRQQNRLLNVYVHPWEVDTEQPRLRGPVKSRFRHYQNLSTTMKKLQSLLTEFHLGPMSRVLAQHQQHVIHEAEILTS